MPEVTHYSSELVQQTDPDFFWLMMGVVGELCLGRYGTGNVDDACSLYLMGGEL